MVSQSFANVAFARAFCNRSNADSVHCAANVERMWKDFDKQGTSVERKMGI
jgi:hypothetical protein